VPLRFQIFPKGANDVAFEAAFTQISFDRPEAGQFTFNPPPGTTVKEQKPEAAAAPERERPEAPKGSAADEPRMIGTGWTTVVMAEVGTPDAAGGEDAKQVTGFLQQLPAVKGAWGSGRLFAGDLFSVLLTDDGRLLGGFVTPERLYEVAGTTK
jgi:hypothetical protein